MESSEQTGANISLQICTNTTYLGRENFYFVLSEYVN